MTQGEKFDHGGLSSRSPRLHQRLEAIVRNSSWCMSALTLARAVELPEWSIGAGAIRNLVWDHLHERSEAPPPGDIDLAYFDPTDVSRERDIALQNRLDGSALGPGWDVVNQAGVHLWYPERFGHEVEPFRSLNEALASWPEFATCVGVRLEPDDSMVIIAPHGLEDLFEMVVRHNPTRITPQAYLLRQQEKQFADRWPRIKIRP